MDIADATLHDLRACVDFTRRNATMPPEGIMAVAQLLKLLDEETAKRAQDKNQTEAAAEVEGKPVKKKAAES